MRLTPEEWGTYFHTFERSAWRLEVQPTYNMPNEQPSLALFRAGEPKPAGHNSKWHETVRNNVAEGRTIGRVRVVRQPLTEYQRYQLAWGIPGNIEAGEDIRILDLSKTGDLGLPEQDWWLFDNSRVVHLNFRPDGTIIDRELIDAPDISRYLHWQTVALGHAVRYEDFRRNDGT